MNLLPWYNDIAKVQDTGGKTVWTQFAEVLQFGGSFPWEHDPNKATVVCPDPANPVVFELRRVLP